jgi:hypothetical protein
MSRLLWLTLLAFLLLVGCNKKTAVEKPAVVEQPMPPPPVSKPPTTKPKQPKTPLPPPRPKQAPRMHEECTWVFLPIFQHCEMVLDEQKD